MRHADRHARLHVDNPDVVFQEIDASVPTVEPIGHCELAASGVEGNIERASLHAKAPWRHGPTPADELNDPPLLALRIPDPHGRDKGIPLPPAVGQEADLTTVCEH